MRGRIVSFDALRFILALCVLFGHTFINLFCVDKTEILCIQNLAVDGFFIMSGFLLALSYLKTDLANKTRDELFIHAIWKKIKRLYPDYLFAMIISLLLSLLLLHKANFKLITFFLNNIFIADINTVSGVIVGSWYVSVLFWVSLIYMALLFYKGKVAVYLYIPLFVFVSFSYSYASYSGLSLNSSPLIANIFSSGFLKGFIGIGTGIILCYICNAWKEVSISTKYQKFFCGLIELIAITIIYYCFNLRQFTKNEYLVYFAYPAILGILYCHKETFLKFLSWKMWKPIAPTAYMLFLTHVVWLEIIKRYIPYKNYPEVVVYASVMFFCVIFAYLCYHAKKCFFAKLKQILFIQQAENSSLNVENPEKDRESFAKLHQRSN